MAHEAASSSSPIARAALRQGAQLASSIFRTSDVPLTMSRRAKRTGPSRTNRWYALTGSARALPQERRHDHLVIQQVQISPVKGHFGEA